MLHWLKDSIFVFWFSTQTSSGQLIHPPTAAHLSMFRMEGNINPKPGSSINLSLHCWTPVQSLYCVVLMQMGRTIQWWPVRNLDGKPHIMTAGGTWDLPHRPCMCRVSCYRLPCPIHCVLSTNLSVIFTSWKQQEFRTVGQLNSVMFCWVLKSLNVGIRVHYSPHSMVGGMAAPPPQQLLLYL